MARYRPLPHEVLAAQWMGDNPAALVAGLELPATTSLIEARAGIEGLLVYNDQGHTQIAFAGDWVVKDVAERLAVLSTDVFKALYEPVE
jgi:hypothetical protein